MIDIKQIAGLPPQITNGNYIRQMSDEELAEGFVIPVTYMNGLRAVTIFEGKHCGKFGTKDKAIAAELAWLRSVKE